MRMMAMICADKQLYAQVEKERDGFYQLIKTRADLFVKEAAEANLAMLPYSAGYFLSVPSTSPDAVCEKLNAENVFAVALGKGVRIAVCAVPTQKIKGMAGKIKGCNGCCRKINARCFSGADRLRSVLFSISFWYLVSVIKSMRE